MLFDLEFRNHQGHIVLLLSVSWNLFMQRTWLVPPVGLMSASINRLLNHLIRINSLAWNSFPWACGRACMNIWSQSLFLRFCWSGWCYLHATIASFLAASFPAPQWILSSSAWTQEPGVTGAVTKLSYEHVSLRPGLGKTKISISKNPVDMTREQLRV